MKDKMMIFLINRFLGIVFILISFLTKAQIPHYKIDSINCYMLSEEMASYEQELTTTEVKYFAQKDGKFFHFDSKNMNCLDSFALIDLSEIKNEIYKQRKIMITKLLIEVYQSDGSVNTIEFDCLLFYRINNLDSIYKRNLGFRLWIAQYLGVKLFSYWCSH